MKTHMKDSMESEISIARRLRDTGFVLTRQGLPAVDEPVIALTSRFQCAAFLARDGHWHERHSRRAIDDVLAWSPLLRH